MADELERLQGAAAIHALADELGLEVGPIRVELFAEPDRALRLMRYALARRSKLKNPAGFVVARFRQGEDAPEARPAPVEEEVEPLTLAEVHGAIAWARKHGGSPPVIEALSAALRVANERGEFAGFTDADRERFGLPADP